MAKTARRQIASHATCTWFVTEADGQLRYTDPKTGELTTWDIPETLRQYTRYIPWRDDFQYAQTRLWFAFERAIKQIRAPFNRIVELLTYDSRDYFKGFPSTPLFEDASEFDGEESAYFYKKLDEVNLMLDPARAIEVYYKMLVSLKDIEYMYTREAQLLTKQMEEFFGTETEEKEMTNQKNNTTLDNYPSIKKEFDDLEQAVTTKAIEVISIKHPSRKLTENDLKREINRIFPRTLECIDIARRRMIDAQYYEDGDVYWKEAEYDDYDRLIEDGDYWTRIEREMIGEARPEFEMTMIFDEHYRWMLNDLIVDESEEYLTSEEKEPSNVAPLDSSSDIAADIMCNYYDELLGYPSKHEKNLKHVRYTWRACASEIRFERDEHRAREVMLATIAAAKISERAKNTIYNLITQIESLHDEWKKIFDEHDGSLYATRHVDAELDAIQAKLNRYAYQIFK